MALHIQTGHWPLIFVDMQSPTDEEYAHYFGRVDEFFLRRQPFAMVINTVESSGNTSSAGRKAQADYMRRHADLMNEYMKGIAVIVRTAPVRAVITSILWMQPAPVPFAVFPTEAEATRWARKQLRDAGITPPLLPPSLLGATRPQSS